MKEAELLRCQIVEWYPHFRRHSFKTLIHPIPAPFLCYLLQDDAPFLLPASASGLDPLPRHPNSRDPFSDDTTLPEDDDDDDDDDDRDASPDSRREPPCFPELESAVQESIAALGGAVFPKLNWSAPKDAASMGAGGTLRCTTFAEVALLLKSSDCISHDLCHALDSCSDRMQAASSPSSSPPDGFQFHLALRRWYGSLRPEMEFRCFVRGRCLVGICQREVTTFYPVLVEKKGALELLIGNFFEVVVRAEFASEDYTFDVYVTGDGRVKIVDFNPWGAYTLPLLFGWEELEGIGRGVVGEGFEFRIIESQCGVRPGLKTAVPFDYIDMGEGSGWDQFLRRADEELRRQSQAPEAGA